MASTLTPQPQSCSQQQRPCSQPQTNSNHTTAAAATTNKNDYEPWSEANLQEVTALWELSAQDECRLRDFQRRVADVKHSWNDPHVLLRYMFAPQGYPASERLFRDMIQWRLANKVDTILEDYTPHPVLLDYASPLAFLEDYDRDGDPIYVERGGAMDGQGLLKRFSKDQLMQHAIWLREVQSSGPWVDQYEARQGRCIRDITVIFDLQGLSTRHYNPSVLAWFQSHMQMTDLYYPGPIKRILIIRAPTIFRIIWSIVKHFFPQTARDKMVFAGPNYLEVLDQYIDKDRLPPVINPKGRGETALGMPKRLEAGRIPDSVGYGGKGYVPVIPTTKATVVVVPLHGRKESSNTTGSSTRTDATSPADVSDGEEEEAKVLAEEAGAATPTPANITNTKNSNNKTPRRNRKLTGRRPCIPQGDWEEIYSASRNSNEAVQVHVLWQKEDSVEITPMDFLTERNLIFI